MVHDVSTFGSPWMTAKQQRQVVGTRAWTSAPSGWIPVERGANVADQHDELGRATIGSTSLSVHPDISTGWAVNGTCRRAEPSACGSQPRVRSSGL